MAPSTANVSANAQLPSTWRLVCTGNGSAVNYTLGAVMMP
jgi:hypothetical protein